MVCLPELVAAPGAGVHLSCLRQHSSCRLLLIAPSAEALEELAWPGLQAALCALQHREREPEIATSMRRIACARVLALEHLGDAQSCAFSSSAEGTRYICQGDGETEMS
jgi:hypothetical protein